MQMMQLSMYSTNVPKFEASTIMVKVLGKAAMWSCVVANQTLEKSPCGRVAIEASAIAEESPNTIKSAMQPMIAEMTARVQMARWG